MSRINLINIETRGVDMKTNPLLLGNKKMHSATNLVFEEGVIKTRPGFRYKSLGCTGQFQGAGEFRPRKGLSATPLSESKSGFVVVADGKIWLNCNKIGEPFSCNGDVHVFQAENYLIFQNPNSSTFWWDGEKLTESPGMVDIDFEEIETPVQEVAVVAPTVSIPTCGIEVSTSVTFTVRDSTTSATIANALVTVYKDGVTVKSGNTDAKGKIYFALLAGTYTYSSSASGFSSTLNKPVTSGVAFVDYTYESCAAPLKLLSGENLVEVRLLPREEVPPLQIRAVLHDPINLVADLFFEDVTGKIVSLGLLPQDLTQKRLVRAGSNSLVFYDKADIDINNPEASLAATCSIPAGLARGIVIILPNAVGVTPAYRLVLIDDSAVAFPWGESRVLNLIAAETKVEAGEHIVITPPGGFTSVPPVRAVNEFNMAQTNFYYKKNGAWLVFAERQLQYLDAYRRIWIISTTPGALQPTAMTILDVVTS